MKQGSTDDPFAEDPIDDTDDENPDDDLALESDQDLGTTSSPLTTESSQTQERSLPYIHARNGVKDGRTQRPVFLREHVEEGIDDLVDEMETAFDERVYKTDVTEAAMVIAQENPELVRAKLEEWGYGWG